MIILLHGDNTEATRNELNRIISTQKGKEIRKLDGKSATDSDIVQAFQAQSMFGGDFVVVIENLFSKLGARKTKRLESIISIITHTGTDNDVIIWEEKELGKTILAQLGAQVQNRLFKTSPQLFKFIDSFGVLKTKQLILLYTQSIQTDAPELIYAMLLKRLRSLIMVKDSVIPPGMQPWQMNRLTSQAKYFTMEKLLMIYKKLLDSEYLIKSGRSPMTLSQHIELVISEM